VSDSVAVPGAAGLPVTVALKLDVVQVMPELPFAVVKNVADGDDSPAVTTSLTGTAVPPALPNVSTLPAAEAGAAGSTAITDAANTVIARYKYLRMPLPSWIR
jgi:hypothetical protein